MVNNYRDIKTMRVWIGGHFGPINFVDFDFESAEVVYTYIELHESRSETKYNFDVSKFIDLLEKYKILEWDEEYTNLDVYDGTQWYIDISYKTNDIRFESHGSNDYPETFKKLCGAISKIIHHSFN